MTELPSPSWHLSPIGAYVLNRACAAPREPLRTLALSMVSHVILLRSTGPLGVFDLDRERAIEKGKELDVLRQTAVIVAGMALGIVFKNSIGKLEVR